MNSRDNVNSQSKTPEIQVFGKDDWESDTSNSFSLSLQKRASECMQHLIKNSHLNGKELNILEVGPLPTFKSSTYIAPIALFQEDIPEHNYLGFGAHLDIIEENEDISLEQMMGKVPFIEGLLYFDDDRLKGNGTKDIVDFFNGRPDIIYGSHVYENSGAQKSTFPVGREGMIEGTARILQEEGYLIIDNACGYLNKTIGIGTSGKSYYSQHMIHVASYFYDDAQTEAIHIFQKPKGTDELARKEIAQKDLDDLNRELAKYNRKIQRLLNSLREKSKFFQRKEEKLPVEIEKLRLSIKNIPSDKVDAISRMNDSISKMTGELETMPDEISSYRKKHALKIHALLEERKEISNKIKKVLSTLD